MAEERKRRWRIGWLLFFSAVVVAVLFVGGFGGSGTADRRAPATPRAGEQLFPPPTPAPTGPTTSTPADDRHVSGEAAGVATASSSTPRPFSVGGRGRGLFSPGGPLVPVDLVFTNRNRRPITITSVTTTIAGTSAGGCSARTFAVVRQLTATPSVPASATRSLSALGVPISRWPQLQMLDSGGQDACRGATVGLRFSGTARG